MVVSVCGPVMGLCVGTEGPGMGLCIGTEGLPICISSPVIGLNDWFWLLNGLVIQ